MPTPYPIIDTHTHLYFAAFAGAHDAVLSECDAAGVVGQVQIGCDEVSCLAAKQLCEQHAGHRLTLGLHPCDVTQVGDPALHRYDGFADYQLQATTHDELWELFDHWATEWGDLVVGFGETGFDRHHRDTPELVALQAECFVAHLRLCRKHNKPVVIHTRAATDTLEVFLHEHFSGQAYRGVVHCFSEGPEFAQLVTDKFGLMIGVGGVATSPQSDLVREAIRRTPLQYILTETDAPFLVPHAARQSGVKRNHAGHITAVVDLIAQLKGLPTDEVGHQLATNAQRFYDTDFRSS